MDGTRPLSAESVAAVSALCDDAEDRAGLSTVVVHVSGAPDGPPADAPAVGLVSKWERVLRRLERLPAVTVAVADADCGGTALDALLATDYRIATASVRLLLPVLGGATWPGMALYRLAQQAARAGRIRRAALFGAPITARDALDLGLVDELIDDVPTALSAAIALTGSVSGPELAIRRQLFLEAPSVLFEEALGAHLSACDRVAQRTGTEEVS
ncbi:enoyl-CoA hydratase/isomerase family protein [Streptomyces mirabilis]|nr:enoyl-CoA hydratase/isomerase family protein [Streptomyces sp. RLB1-33]QUW85361.1 enoyl-CoA hydratase/isomerase family protein [Streptomyces mirabilis]